ncbi:threonine/serine exporter family protein [Enterococcus olivae]
MAASRELVLETCLLAGKIMMESGSEVYRVEDMMNRIAANANEPNSVSYVTATGIFMGLRSSHYTQVENVAERSINLEKVAAVNQLSRAFAEKKIDLLTLHNSLKQIDYDTPAFPLWLQILSAGVMSSLLMYIFGGTIQDLAATFLIGSLGFSVKYCMKILIDLRFFDILLASFIIGTCAILAVNWHLAANMDNIIIGAVMPLVPGVAITTSFRDILAGHMISGLARGTEALIIAASIGVGIATSLSFFGGTIL